MPQSGSPSSSSTGRTSSRSDKEDGSSAHHRSGLPDFWVEKYRKLHFLCPNCDRVCDHVIGELVFESFKEAWEYAFRVCWKCEMVRPCKPFGWKPKVKGAEFPIRWRTFKEAKRAMFLKRGAGDAPIDLSEKGLEKLKERHRRQFRNKGWGHYGARRG